MYEGRSVDSSWGCESGGLTLVSILVVLWLYRLLIIVIKFDPFYSLFWTRKPILGGMRLSGWLAKGHLTSVSNFGKELSKCVRCCLRTRTKYSWVFCSGKCTFPITQAVPSSAQNCPRPPYSRDDSSSSDCQLCGNVFLSFCSSKQVRGQIWRLLKWCWGRKSGYATTTQYERLGEPLQIFWGGCSSSLQCSVRTEA